MKANELRIGNLFHKWDDNSNQLKEVKVYEITDDSLNGFKFLLRESLPIPLTEEWLLKFGFELMSYGSYNKKSEWFEFDVTLYDTGNKNVKDVQLSSTNISGAYPNPLLFQYVHQLQNLYFALTGEELTIKG